MIEMKRLIKNSAKCSRCNDVIESIYNHDFVHCSCGAIFVDGGLNNPRCGYDSPDDFIDLCEYRDHTLSELESVYSRVMDSYHIYGISYDSNEMFELKHKINQLRKEKLLCTK